MSRLFVRAGVAGLVALTASAWAQSNVQPEVTSSPSADSAATAPSTPAPSTSATTPTAPSSTAPPAGEANARAATPREVGTMVQSEFPTRDANNDGGLDRSEFTAWLRELVANSPGASGDAAGLDARIGTAFTQSDADGSGSISEAEMTALLSRRQ